jgi:hypothetical protein
LEHVAMIRSGYGDDYGDDDPLAIGRWRQAVKRAIEGKRGQAFLRELADAMDAMSVKELIAQHLVTTEGCCAVGVVCAARGLDVSMVDEFDPGDVGDAVGIARAMAAEIEFENDECGRVWDGSHHRDETPAERWTRMRKWVAKHTKELPCE